MNKDLINKYKTVFETQVGKDVLADMMNRACFMDSTLVPGDPQGTAFNEGRRTFLLSILKFLSPEQALEVYNNHKLNNINTEVEYD